MFRPYIDDHQKQPELKGASRDIKYSSCAYSSIHSSYDKFIASSTARSPQITFPGNSLFPATATNARCFLRK